MIFNVGDRVRIIDCQQGVKPMAKRIGEITTIRKVYIPTNHHSWYFLDGDDDGFVWHEDWLEHADIVETEIAEKDILSLVLE